jgi:hypothetical protein
MPVDWKNLHHANGPAVHIPKWLGALCSDNGSDRRAREQARYEAYSNLKGSLVRDGQWFTASLPTAEQLVEFIRERRLGTRWALRLLGDMACGGHLHWLATGRFRQSATESADSRLRALLVANVASIRDCLSGGNDQHIRKAAAFLLGCLPELAVETLPELTRCALNEPDEQVLACECFSLSILLARTPGDLQQDGLFQASEHTASVVRGLTALGSLLQNHALTDDSSIRLFELLALESHQTEICWGDGLMDHLVAAVCRSLGDELACEVVVRTLAHARRASDPWSLHSLASAAISVGGFPQKWEESAVALTEELSAFQRRIAEALADCPPMACVDHGVPRHPRAIGRWLGMRPPTMLEEPIEILLEGTPVRRPRWWVWRNHARCGILSSNFEQFLHSLTPFEQLKLTLEFDVNSYHIIGLDQRPNKAEYLRQLVDPAVWADPIQIEAWINELLEDPMWGTPAGPISQHAPYIVECVARLIQGVGLEFKREWAALVPCQGSDLKEIAARIPREVLEEGVYRGLLFAGEEVGECVVDWLELVLSERVVGRLLELDEPLSHGDHLSSETSSSFRDKLGQLALSQPEIRDWTTIWRKRFDVQLEERFWTRLADNSANSAASVVASLDRVPSRRLIERLLDLKDSPDPEQRLLKWPSEALDKKLAQLGETNPDIALWVTAWREKAHERQEKSRKNSITGNAKGASPSQEMPKKSNQDRPSAAKSAEAKPRKKGES